MVKKEFMYRGKSLEQLQALSEKELRVLLPSASRRKLDRGYSEQEKLFLKNLESSSKPVKTHCRDILILPNMVGKQIKVHTGNQFADVLVQPEMIGHRLGEFAFSRKRVQHSVGGVAKKGAPKRK